MYVNNIIARDLFQKRHEEIGCSCDEIITEATKFARDNPTAILLFFTNSTLSDFFGAGYIAHGEQWLIRLLGNLQMSRVAEVNRRPIKKIIKDAGKVILDDFTNELASVQDRGEFDITTRVLKQMYEWDDYMNSLMEDEPKRDEIEGILVDYMADTLKSRGWPERMVDKWVKQRPTSVA